MPEDLFADAFNEDGDTDLDSDSSLPFNDVAPSLEVFHEDCGDPLDTLGEETKHEDECQQTKEKKERLRKNEEVAHSPARQQRERRGMTF